LKFTEGSFLHGLVNQDVTEYFKFQKGPVYNKDIYLRMLKYNYESVGLKYIEPILPVSIKIKKSQPVKEPELSYGDTVYVKMRILKSGVVRIKLDASIATLHEKYYSKGKRPPSKSIIQAYKSMGFSEGFLEKIKKNFVKKEKEQKRVENIIDKLFNKDPVKKVKKKKEEEVIIEEEKEIENIEAPEDDEVEEDDTPEEDEGLDVEPDAEEEVEEEPGEEEYNSD
jgi:hypothetical protein|tara:strand:- start:2104 stop:2778 length:675 start_codon:yes stop_codon:yes gene_type:complete